MADDLKTPRGITQDRYLNAVRCGAHDACVEMFRDSDTLLDAVRDGIREATKALVREREAMIRRQEAAAESAPEPGTAPEEEMPKP
jgi:hypothetical protein